MKLAQLMLLTMLSSATLALRADADPPNVGKGQNDVHGPMKLTYRWQDDKPTNLPLMLPDARIVWSDGTILLPTPGDPPVVPTIPTTRVEIDVNKVRIADALKKLFDQVGERYELDSDVPANTRITLRVRNVSFLTALQAMVEQADLSWTLQAGATGEARRGLYKIGNGKRSTTITTTSWTDSRFKPLYIPWTLQDNNPILLPWSQDGRPAYIDGHNLLWNDQMPTIIWRDSPTSTVIQWSRMPKASSEHSAHDTISLPVGPILRTDSPNGNGTNLPTSGVPLSGTNGSQQGRTTVNKVPLLSDLPIVGNLFTTRVREERSIFTCPHCYAQATVIRNHETPICPECGRAFEAQWKVCPFDGAKRPVAAGEWLFCPICGKSIAGAETRRNKQ